MRWGRWVRWVPWVLTIGLASLLVCLIAVDLDWSAILGGARENIVFATALIATVSLAFAAWSFGWSKLIERREATLRAWKEFSAGLSQSRIPINRHIPKDRIAPEQASALSTSGLVLVDRHGVQLTPEQKAEVLDSVLRVLNGLEHLAVGVHYSLYRKRILVSIGGTTILACWNRFEPFVRTQRRDVVAKASQRYAWAHLEILKDDIRRSRKVERTEQLAAS